MEDGKGLSNDVILEIQVNEKTSTTSKQSEDSAASDDSRVESQIGLALQGSGKPGLTVNLPPKPPSEVGFRRRSLAHSAFSRTKSRLAEPTNASRLNLVEEAAQTVTATSPFSNSPAIVSPSTGTIINNLKESSKASPKTSAPVTPKAPLVIPPGDKDDDDEDDDLVYKSANFKSDKKKRGQKVKVLILIEWMIFVCLIGVLVASLTIDKLRDRDIWSLEIWKWCVLVLVIFCGRLVTGWFTNTAVFLIERNFLLKKKVLYFLYSLRTGVRILIWLSLILLAWGLLIARGVDRSRETTKIFNRITRGIASSLFGAVLWILKTLFIKWLASSFHVKTFFDRIQEAIFHQYVLQTLSKPASRVYRENAVSLGTSGKLSFSKKGKEKEKKEDVIDVDKLSKIKKEKVSAWTMGGLIKVITNSESLTISSELDETVDEEGIERKEITSELEAKLVANQVFKNVAKPGSKHIEEDDLLLFMTKEDVDQVLPLFERAVELGRIKMSSFRKWVLNVYNERKCLAHSLKDTKTAIEELNKIVTTIVLVVIITVWLLLTGIATTEVLVFISSQLLLVVFMFGNTAKTLFEGIIFVFVMHPFDVGDRCVVDGVQMVVEEVNIFTTVFLRHDNEKIYYPNAVLATKPISNFNRSPEMGDFVEFSIDFSTSVESIAALKSKIKSYLDSKPKYWQPGHSVLIKEIEDVNKLKMVLGVTHTINFQNASEKSNRRSELVFELKKIFEELGIKYRLLPQEVHITYVDSGNLTPSAAARR